MTAFSNQDKQQLISKGIAAEKVVKQIETFKEGIPFVKLDKAAVVGEGILKFTEEDEHKLIEAFEAAKNSNSLLKFVPASGAASRMFKAFFSFLGKYNPQEEELDAYIKRTGDKDIEKFSERLINFPFYEIIQKRINGKFNSKGEELFLFVNEMLSEQGLNYGFYPKGLLPFHNYGDYAATPFEEHLKEAALYATAGGEAKLHFTISEQHGEMFNAEFDAIKERVSTETNASYDISYSFQKAQTDTIAVTMDNELFREENGTLLFRPGGHGALIENLNEQDADIIFIKNIDNVVPSRNIDKVAASKEVLGGLLVRLQEKAFKYATQLEHKSSLDFDLMMEIKSFLEKDLNARFSDNFESYTIAQQIEILIDKINRPIRICGMVKNEGEPGGGPFWIKDTKGNISLQIIESAQIDASNVSQMNILKNATHFNPVDLVCGVKNFKGEKFNLINFVDVKQGFITDKTKDGKELKALELPGLWNGAMAFWNTIFVEVPLVTFNPVKTVNDLLKESHQVRK
ncbi:hypothetical protein Celal_1072 [Cellulophaga algicola DSM 14237]|uniref:DUF4301 domain-containing protein n=1 Tax=Cellulophaga algicola (strain DSM 14237 / IC166 / ACAM 630) TaxID=688270 RepID=E6X5N1_CELAD|nr:DUF4301 family protein [Cellulophaga algicola]ADV48397.1 hypothetical protein Celal_1072 [Cellulophaga algicola DSM 14237]